MGQVTCDLDSAPEGLKTRPRASASAGLPETCAARTLSPEVPEKNEPVRLGNTLVTFWTANLYGNVATVRKEDTEEPTGRLGGQALAWLQASGARPAGADICRTVSQSDCAKMKMTSRLGRTPTPTPSSTPPPPPDKALHMRANNNNTSTTCSKLF